MSKLLTQREVAALLGLSHRSLERWRVNGDGPAFIKIGANGRVRYEEATVLGWLASQRRRSTSDTGRAAA